MAGKPAPGRSTRTPSTKRTSAKGAVKGGAKAQGRKVKVAAIRRAQAGRLRRRRTLMVAALAVAVVAVVGVLYATYQNSSTAVSGTTPRGDYQVGRPGAGEKAPQFTLPSSAGGKVSLSTYRGKRVLLYFQEGVGCQPCFDQITDLEKDAAKIKAAGIDQVISITTSPLDAVTQKSKDMGLTTPVLSDPDVSVSRAYRANEYRMQMMGPNFDGHSFLLVDPDGTIRWRADYGGPPKETMYVPVDRLLADIEAGNR
jgi:peroxiredoxin